MTFLLGLTGSIGMGKSTTARMFAEAGVPVWDADAAVHHLYAKDGAAVAPLGAIFPGIVKNGAIDRSALKTEILNDPNALALVENVVHPLVAASRQAFIDATDADLVLFDLPLLFETGANVWLDAVAVVTAPAEVQRARVMARDGMTERQFQFILSRQVPDAEKRAQADYIIETLTMDDARAAVADVIRQIREQTHA